MFFLPTIEVARPFSLQIRKTNKKSTRNKLSKSEFSKLNEQHAKQINRTVKSIANQLDREINCKKN